jgi:hypothetical protein
MVHINRDKHNRKEQGKAIMSRQLILSFAAITTMPMPHLALAGAPVTVQVAPCAVDEETNIGFKLPVPDAQPLTETMNMHTLCISNNIEQVPPDFVHRLHRAQQALKHKGLPLAAGYKSGVKVTSPGEDETGCALYQFTYKQVQGLLKACHN